MVRKRNIGEGKGERMKERKDKTRLVKNDGKREKEQRGRKEARSRRVPNEPRILMASIIIAPKAHFRQGGCVTIGNFASVRYLGTDLWSSLRQDFKKLSSSFDLIPKGS